VGRGADGGCDEEGCEQGFLHDLKTG
jgi:hypothetical protein